MGQRVRTVVRRTVDPGARQIVEDVRHDGAGAEGARSFHVVMAVAGDRFTLREVGGAFTGTGTLSGEPWRWTSWTSTSQISAAGVEVTSEDEVTETGLAATREIRKAGQVVGTTAEQLQAFDCAAWDQAEASLAVPAPGDAVCERACRNSATLRYWHAAEAAIAALPAADQADARKHTAAVFETKLEAGMASCLTQCRTAGNAVQVACMADAASVEQLAACDAD